MTKFFSQTELKKIEKKLKMYMIVDCKNNIIITIGYMYKKQKLSCLKLIIITKMNINAVFDLLNNQETLDEGFRLLLELHKKYLYAVFWDKLSEHNITKKLF